MPIALLPDGCYRRPVDSLWWSLTVFLMLFGLVGTVLPLIPGTILIFAGAVLNFLTLKAIGWPTILVLAVLMILSQVIDFLSGAAGAKWFGASRWGAIGGILGAIIGIFFGIIGLFVGPLVGALLGELLGGKGILPAGKSSWGTFLGTTAGLVAKVLIGLLMVGWFAVAAVL